MNEVRVIPVQGIPEIKTDDNLAEITFEVLQKNKVNIQVARVLNSCTRLLQKLEMLQEC